MGAFYACPSCLRHVRADEAACPFCGAPLDPEGAPRRRYPSERLSRAAQLAFTVTLGAHLVECSSRREPNNGAASPADLAVPPSPTFAPAPQPAVASAVPDAGSTKPPASHRGMRIVLEYGAPVSVLERVCFSSGAARVPGDAHPTILAVAEVLGIHPFELQVHGHVGPEEAQMAGWLPRKRAQSVIHALVAAGVSPDRLKVSTEDDGIRARCVTFRAVPVPEDGGASP